jgi:hypothetical protein
MAWWSLFYCQTKMDKEIAPRAMQVGQSMVLISLVQLGEFGCHLKELLRDVDGYGG